MNKVRKDKLTKFFMSRLRFQELVGEGGKRIGMVITFSVKMKRNHQHAVPVYVANPLSKEYAYRGWNEPMKVYKNWLTSNGLAVRHLRPTPELIAEYREFLSDFKATLDYIYTEWHNKLLLAAHCQKLMQQTKEFTYCMSVPIHERREWFDLYLLNEARYKEVEAEVKMLADKYTLTVNNTCPIPKPQG